MWPNYFSVFNDNSITNIGWLGVVTVRASDLRWSGRGFDSRSGRYQATYSSTLNSAFHPSGVGKSSTGLVGWGYGGARSVMLCGKWGNGHFPLDISSSHRRTFPPSNKFYVMTVMVAVQPLYTKRCSADEIFYTIYRINHHSSVHIHVHLGLDTRVKSTSASKWKKNMLK